MSSTPPNRSTTFDHHAQNIFGRRLSSHWLDELRAAVGRPSPILIDALALRQITVGEIAAAIAVGVVPRTKRSLRYVFIEELEPAPLAASMWRGPRWLRLDPIATDQGEMALCVRINHRGLEGIITLGSSRIKISGAVATLILQETVPASVLDAMIGEPVKKLVAHPLLMSPDYVVEDAIDLGGDKCCLTLRAGMADVGAIDSGTSP